MGFHSFTGNDSVVLDCRNILHAGGQYIRQRITTRNLRGVLQPVFRCIDSLNQNTRTPNIVCVLHSSFGRQICNAMVNLLHAHARNTCVAMYTGALRCGDDLLAIQLGMELRAPVVTNDRFREHRSFQFLPESEYVVYYQHTYSSGD